MNVRAPHVQKVLACVKRLKLKHTCPAYQEDCLAHIGLTDHKIAFYIRHEIKSLSGLRERWEAHGWRLIHVTPSCADSATDEQLDDQLREALKVMGRGR
jgi:hypothetical protein